MKVYLAGPMRGYSNWNFPLFKQARELWQSKSHHVYCPARLIDALGYNLDDETVDHARLTHVLQSDILCLCNSNALALLPNWEGSTGATMEVAAAQFLKLPVYHALTMDRIHPECCPWGALLDSTDKFP